MFEKTRRLLTFGLTGTFIIALNRPAEADHKVGITNAGTRPITSVFMSVPRLNDWGEDHLHGDQLRPGYTLTVQLNDQCIYDILVTYADGSKQLRPSWDTCHQNATFR